MIVVMKSQATDADVKHVVDRIEQLGLKVHLSKGVERTIIGVIGDERLIKKEQLSLLPLVENVIPILKPYKLASREFKPSDSVINVAGVAIGGKSIAVVAGPCSVETEEQLMMTAEAVKSAGARLLRGGAYKPRTSPYAFQGLGEDGLSGASGWFPGHRALRPPQRVRRGQRMRMPVFRGSDSRARVRPRRPLRGHRVAPGGGKCRALPLAGARTVNAG